MRPIRRWGWSSLTGPREEDAPGGKVPVTSQLETICSGDTRVEHVSIPAGIERVNWDNLPAYFGTSRPSKTAARGHQIRLDAATHFGRRGAQKAERDENQLCTNVAPSGQGRWPRPLERRSRILSRSLPSGWRAKPPVVKHTLAELLCQTASLTLTTSATDSVATKPDASIKGWIAC